MATSLYEVTVGTYKQILGATGGFLKKGKNHCEENGIDLSEVIETRLYPDMLPFTFQVTSVAHHSLGALKAVQGGLFTPPSPPPDIDYEGLQGLISDADAGLEEFTPEIVNALEDNELIFKFGKMEMPFVGKAFLLGFSFPNFYFHATTAYDILRMKGVPIGKRDFMGAPR